MALKNYIELFGGAFGGINTKVSPDKINENESPDASNVIGDDILGNIITAPGYSAITMSVANLEGDYSGNPLAINGGRLVSFSNGSKYALVHCGCNLYIGTIHNPELVITNTVLLNGQVGVAYTDTLTASGGATPYGWAVADPAADPPGLSIDMATGVYSGTPTQAGTYRFSIGIADSGSGLMQQLTRKGFVITIAP